MTDFLQRFRYELEIGFLAAALMSAVFLFVWNTVGMQGFMGSGNDAVQYVILGENFLEGHGFSLRNSPPYVLTAVRTPGYPLFLAFSKALSGGYFLALVLQIAAYAGIVVLTYRIAMMLFERKNLALVAAVLFFIDLGFISVALSLMSDALFAFFTVASLYLFLQFLRRDDRKFVLWSFFFLGVSAFIRPLSLSLFPLYCIFAGWRWWKSSPRRVLSLAGTLGGAALIISLFLVPWSVRNFTVFGTFRLSSADAFALYPTLASQIIAFRDNTSHHEARLALLQRLEDHEQEPKLNLSSFSFPSLRGEILGSENFQYRDWMIGEFKTILFAAPRAYAEVVAFAAFDYFTKPLWLTPLLQWEVIQDLPFSETSYHQAFSRGGVSGLLSELKSRLDCGLRCITAFGFAWVGRVYLAAVSLLSLMGLAGMLRLRGEGRRAVLFILLAILVFALPHILLQGLGVQPRYRMPIAPLLTSFAVYGIVLVKEKMRSVIKG